MAPKRPDPSPPHEHTDQPTLRDLLAAHALQGILAGWHKELHPNTEGIAEAAWAYADAMLASRGPEA
jgi:hypothetical protein